MDKTQLRLVPDMPTCNTCRHMDLRNPQSPLCRRHSPQVAGGVIMVQQVGQLSPVPRLMIEAYWPVIGDPTAHWCGEHYSREEYDRAWTEPQ